MNDEARLLIGTLTDAEYRGRLVAGRRGLRYPVARPGWSRRWYRVLEGIAALAVLLFTLAAFSTAIVVLGAAGDAVPR